MGLPDAVFTTLKKDFQSLVDEMLDRIPYFTPEWTDRTLSDPGIALIHVFAWVLDAYYWTNELLLNEGFLFTCRRRSSLLLHLQQLGTTMLPPNAATANVTVTVESVDPTVGPGVTYLRSGFQLQATLPDDVLIFEMIDDSVALPGANQTVDIAVREQITIGSPVSLGNSNGRPFQTFLIPSDSVLHNDIQQTIEIQVGGVQWTEANLAYSGPLDQHYMVLWQADGRPLIVFGDGDAGAIPALGSNISAIYAEGGGIRGNKASEGTILQTVSAAPRGYRLSVTNSEGASGGSDWETFERARRRGPIFWATQDRAVTAADYEALVLSVPGVAKVRAEPSGYSTVMIWIVPSGGGQASSLLRAVALFALEDRIGTDVVSMGTWDPGLGDYRTAYYAEVDIALNLRVEDRYSRTQVRGAVGLAIQSWLSISERNFGEVPSGYLYLSDLFEVVEGVVGVNSVDVGRFSRATEVYWDQKTGDGVVTSITPTSSAVNETWTVTFISSSSFTVAGSLSGGQGFGFVDTEFTAADGQLVMLISSGATSYQNGDNFWFKTSRRVGNIPLDPREFPTLRNLVIAAEGGY